jgi:hypothetical protein
LHWWLNSTCCSSPCLTQSNIVVGKSPVMVIKKH